MTSISNPDFSRVFSIFPTGVSVVTVGQGGVEGGLTVSWACPVSLNPPLLMMSIHKHHYSRDLIDTTHGFVLNVLKKGQERLAAHFAKQSYNDADKLDDIPHREGENGSAILTEALAYFDCEVEARYEHGDHIVFIGAVTNAEVLCEGEPLLAGKSLHYAPSR